MREAGEVPMTRTRPRLFYGWWVVVTSALALFLGPIPIMVFSFGVFLKPLIKEFHSGRGAVSLAFTLHNAVTAFGLPFAGRLVDHFGARRVILPSTFAVGLILLSAYFCSGGIWKLYLFYMALGFAGCGAAPVSYCDVISHWFDRYRGLALGFMMFGLGAGALIMPSAAQYLIAIRLASRVWHFRSRDSGYHCAGSHTVSQGETGAIGPSAGWYSLCFHGISPAG
jgi:MFS family permease